MGNLTHSLAVILVIGCVVNLFASGASFFKNTEKVGIRGPRDDNSTLEFLVVVTRHGNRAPLYGLPNDEYPSQNTTYWPFSQGLTTVGRQQLYNLGVKLHSVYEDYLGTQFFNDDVYVSSTGVQRVVESGKLLMAGLYPPTGGQIWNKNLMWQPVPVHQDSLDKTVEVNMGCNRFTTEQTVIEAAFAEKWADNITYFTDYVSTAINSSVSGTFGVVEIWDTLLSEDVEGYTLPDWAATVYPDAMYPMMNDMYVQYVAGTDELVRLVLGPFFAEMMDVIESKINKTMNPDRKMYYWSGHDDTLITLQAALGLATKNIVGVVQPGSAIVIEIHQNSQTLKYFLEAFYIDGRDSDLEPVQMKIPHCGSPCQFTKFKKLVAKFTNVTSANYNQECST